MISPWMIVYVATIFLGSTQEAPKGAYFCEIINRSQYLCVNKTFRQILIMIRIMRFNFSYYVFICQSFIFTKNKFLAILHPLGQVQYCCLVQVLFILLKSNIWLITVLLAQVASLFTLFRNLFVATFPLLFPFVAFLCFRFVFAIRDCKSRKYRYIHIQFSCNTF